VVPQEVDTIGDYKGLKMRMGTNLGGKIVARAGARRSSPRPMQSSPPSSGV